MIGGFWWAKSGNNRQDSPQEFTNSFGMKFVKVHKGTFWMGGGSVRPPTEQVEIKNDFYLGVYTVTQSEWQAVMGNNPSYFSRDGEGKGKVRNIPDADLSRFPVESVSWTSVQEFITKLNEKAANSGWTYRLPSEAEWEYACRGGTTSKADCSFNFYFDQPTNDLLAAHANFDGKHPAGNGEKGQFLCRPTPVGSYRPNKLGLYDMHGDVWQWCADLYAVGGPARAIRGGGWYSHGLDCTASYRGKRVPDGTDSGVGFRLLAIPSGEKQSK